jgi:formate-dependent nitrite reductase cytochrome c552 subunit
MTFVKEELVKTHLKEKIGCIDCHGLSEKHANDENIGATKPDITFKRPQVDANCAKCHQGHNAPAKAVIARFCERRLSAASPPICTDCHGTHKIERSAEIHN